ncbi:hypothetical protein ACFL47_07245 [Candidatus Latescibacterota bacterium]
MTASHKFRWLFAILMIGLMISTVSSEARQPEKPVSPHTSLVFPGDDGRLKYSPDEFGNSVPDFSHAGYMGGGVRIPDVPVKATVKPGGDNDSGRIQAAIDKVSNMPADKNGFRGAVLIKRGRYTLDEPIRITTGGVILRGEGQDANGSVLFGRGVIKDLPWREKTNGANLVFIEGTGSREEDEPTSRKITDEFVPVGAVSFAVASISGYSVGDAIVVRSLTTREWFEDLDLDYDAWGDNVTTYSLERTITAIEKNRVTIDVPLTCPIESKWGGGEIVKYTEPGRIRKSGVENLRGESDFDRKVRRSEYGNMDRQPYIGAEYFSDEDHYFNFIRFDNLCDGWVRNVTAVHFARSCVYLAGGVKRVTVQDCESIEPVSVCAGGRRFTFLVNGQLCLVQRCTSDKGRHSFVLGGRMTPGPNVFLHCTATVPFSSSEPHSQLVVGSLYDNVKAPLALRYALSKPARWMGIYNYLWNCEGMYLVQKPPHAQNYAFGHVGIHAVIFNKGLIEPSYPNGHIESWNEPVEPKSLYLKQLEDRLGKQALDNIGWSR